MQHTSQTPVIVVEGLNKSFDERHVLHDVSFSIHRGEIVGFLGPNGAGKTTTMRIICGYTPYCSGKVQVWGFDISDNPIQVKEKIGYLPELPPLYNDMTVMAYLRFVSQLKGIPSGKIGDAMERTIYQANLETVADRIISRLSKGFRQRVGLAQSLLNDPSILILDEPTSGLDPIQISEFRSLIKSLSQDRTVIVSTHILSEVSSTCERVLILHEGRIVASDTIEILTRQKKNGESAWVKLKGDRSQVENCLKQQSWLSEFKVDQLTPEFLGITLEADTMEILAQKWFEMSHDQDWVIYELRPMQESLENVFLNLTRSQEDIAL